MKNPFSPGTQFEGRYEILSELGEGGFGAVHKARQISTGQLVALKIMRLPEHGGSAATDTRSARFLREARLCAKLHHPNIVQLLDSGATAEGRQYSVFSLVPGETLASLLSREGALAPSEAQRLMLQVLDALTCAHAQGVIHRDLKPSNIMVSATGARRHALVLDFGIGTLAAGIPGETSARITGSLDTLGTPGYGAPEQWRGLEPTPRADLFAWGLLLLECLLGKPVFASGSAGDVLYQQLGPEPVPVPDALAQHPLGALLRAATQKDVAARDVTARGLFEQLEACDVRGLSREALLGQADLGDASLAMFVQDFSSEGRGAQTDARAAPAAERRHLTALCCRVVAVPSAPGSADAEALDEQLRTALQRCAEVARRHGGRATAALGDAVLFYFGYPRAEEDDARRAVRAALAMTESISGNNERLAAEGVRVESHIGLHMGLLVPGALEGLAAAGIVLGATPRLAAELAASAEAFAIAVSADAERSLRAQFELEPCAARREGEPTPATFRLLRERAPSTPAPTAEAAKVPLIGRDHELELLVERWRRVQDGAGQCSLLSGEPGIGKSRLARELCARLGAHRLGFLEARCAPDTQNAALFPIVELLARTLGVEQEPESAAKIARLEVELSSRGFSLSEAMPLFAPLFSLPLSESYARLDVSPQRQKDLTLQAILSLLLAATDAQPLLLLVEDLHWADPTTLEFLAQVVREAPSARIFLLLTARPEFSPAFSTAGMLQLPLGRLDRAQVAGMASELLGHQAVRPEVIEQIASRTDGVPLFVEELTRMMLESGVLLDQGDGYELQASLSELRIPSTLRAWLSVRLDRLERAKETAQLAAALGREFNVEILSAASPLGPVAVSEDLDRLVAAGLVLRKRRVNEVSCSFKHALVRDAAYESLPRAARQLAHSRIAAALEERFSSLVRTRPDLLAHHHAAAEQKPDAIRYAQQAAHAGLARSAYSEAVGHATQVIEWSAALPAEARVELEIDANGVLAQSMMALGGWADARVKAVTDRSTELLQKLDRRSPHRVPTLWSLFAYHHTTSHRRQACAVADELLVVARESGDPGFCAAASTMRGIALQPGGDIRGTERDLERAIELYDPVLHRDHGVRFGMDSLVLAKALLGYPRWMAGDTQGAFELAAAAVDWGRELGHAPSIAIGLLYGCHIYQYEDDRGAVAAMSGEILALAAKYGLPAYEGYAAIFQAWAAGDVERTDAIVQVLTRMGAKLCLSYYGSLVADNLARRGALDEALAAFDRCIELCTENDEHYYEPELHRQRALVTLQKSPTDEPSARASLERAIELAQRQHAPRIEVMATRLLLDRLGGNARQRARLDELFEQTPALRAL